MRGRECREALASFAERYKAKIVFKCIEYGSVGKKAVGQVGKTFCCVPGKFAPYLWIFGVSPHGQNTTKLHPNT